MKKTITSWMFIGLLAFLTACGGSATTDAEAEAEAEEAQEELEDTLGEEAENAIPDTASDVVTTLADVNGFTIVTELFNPHSYDIYGTEVKITAFVKDHSNNPVSDGTVVSFVADDNGLIEDQCITSGGVCFVTWTSARDSSQPVSPPASHDPGYVDDFKVTIMARTIGEDSFIDKNSNSLYDPGETWFTQSEAFIDTDDNGSYDSDVNNFDEYFDFNKDGVYNDGLSNTLFRGDSCSTTAIAAGHCKARLEVWNTVTMINSDGNSVNVILRDCNGNTLSNVDLTINTCFTIELQDVNGNVPPIGTKLSVTTDVGDIKTAPPSTVPNVYIQPGSGLVQGMIIAPQATDQDDGVLTITVESVTGLILGYPYLISD